MDPSPSPLPPPSPSGQPSPHHDITSSVVTVVAAVVAGALGLVFLVAEGLTTLAVGVVLAAVTLAVIRVQNRRHANR